MLRTAILSLAVAATIALGVATAAEGSPGSARTAIVSLGDSFISGEGGRWLGNGADLLGTRSGSDRAAGGCDGWGYCFYEPERVYGESERSGCHRSDVAPIRSAPVAVDRKVNLACSGARAANLWPARMGGWGHFGEPPQADALGILAAEANVRMVVVAIGANDAGFGRLVANCALGWARGLGWNPTFCADAARADLEAALPAAERGVRRALAGVRQTMAEAGYAIADYRLVAMGYASPLPPGRWIRYPETGWSRLDRGGCPFWNADADWAAGEATGSIDAAIERAARAVGAEYLDVSHALDGHQLCDRRSRRVGPEGPSPEGAEWVRRFSFVEGSPRESLHPNAYGQRALGTCIGRLYLSPVGSYACRLEAGGTYVDGMRIEPLG